jgi:hypothetical protein
MLKVTIGSGVRVSVVKDDSVMPRYCGFWLADGEEEGRLVVRTTIGAGRKRIRCRSGSDRECAIEIE